LLVVRARARVRVLARNYLALGSALVLVLHVPPPLSSDWNRASASGAGFNSACDAPGPFVNDLEPSEDELEIARARAAAALQELRSK
jgi:hypothetical protein